MYHCEQRMDGGIAEITAPPTTHNGHGWYRNLGPGKKPRFYYIILISPSAAG